MIPRTCKPRNHDGSSASFGGNENQGIGWYWGIRKTLGHRYTCAVFLHSLCVSI